jgi:hypothetical protein
MIDPAYISAFAALVGTFVGGITSIATSWLGQQRQSKEQRRAREKTELQALYKQFIQEASKLYLDALEHNKTFRCRPNPRSNWSEMGLHSPFLSTRLVQYLAAIWHILSPPLTEPAHSDPWLCDDMVVDQHPALG